MTGELLSATADAPSPAATPGANGKNDRVRRIAGVAAALAAAQTAWFWKSGIYDDAYITFRYARNLARGFGPVFNVGERVEGCTTFLQMAVLAAFAWLGVDLRLAATAIGFGCLFAIAIAGARFIVRAETAAGDETAWPWFFAVLLVGCSPATFWAKSGMETTWYAAAYFGALLVASREVQRERLPLGSALLTTAAALLRPDGVALAGAIGLYWLTAAPRRRWRNAAAFGAIFAILYGGYFAWRYHYYGYLAPNTYYAKVGSGSARLVLRGLIYTVWSVLWMYFPLLAAWLGARAARRRLPLAPWEKLFLFGAGSQIALTIWTGGDYLPYYRFLLPLLPTSLLLVWNFDRKLTGDVAPASRAAQRLRLHLRPLPLLGLLIAVNVALWLGGANGLRSMISTTLTRKWEQEAEQMKPLLPPDAVVAADAIGASGYILDLPLIDIMGLTDATIAHLPIRTGAGQAGHEKFDPDYILSRAPDFILTCVLQWTRPLPSCVGGRFEKDTMSRSPQLLERYAFANHAMPDGRYTATYVRRDHLQQPGYEGWFVSRESVGLDAIFPPERSFTGFLHYSPNGPGH